MSEVTSYRVTGDWRHIVDDGMVDLDGLPDEALPTGHVIFTPVSPKVAVAGAPAVAHTLAQVKALIAGGELTDLQGRPGVLLAGEIGGHTVRWKAHTNLEYQKRKIDYPDVTFDLTADSHLTGLIHMDVPGQPAVVLDPRIEALAASLEEVDQAVATAEGYASDAAAQVTLAGQEADRAIGLAGAQDAHIASTLEDPQSATHAAFKAVGNATYARAIQVVADGTDQTAKINQALALGVDYGARKTVKLVGDFTITAPLVIHSNTRLDCTDATITKAATVNFKMLHNASMYGTGSRDHDMHVVGGLWLRPPVESAPVPDPNDAHSILFHRADHITVSDITFDGDGPIKYAVYGVDVTHFTAERIDVTSTSDGVHVTGPAEHITIRDIIGTVEDDLISFTGRDYDNWELTPGGGDISKVIVEKAHIRTGNGNVVKLLPGLNKVMSQVVVRSISGDGHHSTVTLFEDEHLPATTGGVAEDILIDGVRGAPVVGYLVNVRHPDVRNVTIRNIDISDNAAPRAIAFSRAGTVQRATIDGVTSSIPYTGSVVHVGGGVTVQSLQLSNVAVQCSTGLGTVVQVSGTIDTLQGANINQSGGRAVVSIDGAGQCPKLAISGLASTATLGVFVNNASAAVECHLSGVTVLPTARLVAVNAGSVFLRGHGIVYGDSHITISSGATSASIRATGMDVRVDASTLTPQPGDAVFNTNASLKAGVGPATWSGTEWKAVGALAPSQLVRTWDVPNIEPGRSADLTTSMGPGTAAVGDFARAVPPPDFPAGLIWSAFVSAADTVTVRVANMTAAAINPAPGTWKVAVNKT